MNQQHQAHLLIHNISKPKNIGTIIRNAAAFNITKVYLIGKETNNKKKFKIIEGINFFGNHGTHDQMEYQIFPNLREAKQHFKENNLFVCGVEIGQEAQNVATNPFRGDTVFFLGNEGTGLLPEHKAICDHFVYIPQYTNKTASLNVSVASGIIFHHFALWAKFKEVEFIGEKFQDQSQIEQDQSQGKQQQKQEKQVKKVEQQYKQKEQVEKTSQIEDGINIFD